MKRAISMLAFGLGAFLGLPATLEAQGDDDGVSGFPVTIRVFSKEDLGLEAIKSVLKTSPVFQQNMNDVKLSGTNTVSVKYSGNWGALKSFQRALGTNAALVDPFYCVVKLTKKMSEPDTIDLLKSVEGVRGIKALEGGQFDFWAVQDKFDLGELIELGVKIATPKLATLTLKAKGKKDDKDGSAPQDRSAALSQLKEELEKMVRVLKVQSAGAGDEESLLVLSCVALKASDLKKIADKTGWEVVIK